MPALLEPHLYRCISTTRPTGDLRDLATGVRQLGSRMESELNGMLKAIADHMTSRGLRDCRCDVDAITDAFNELAGLIDAAASAAAANNRLPVEVSQ